MMWYCFASIVLTLHTRAYFPTWRLLVSFWFRSILVRESTVRDIIFQFGVQSHYFQSQRSEHGRSEPLFFRGVQSHYFSESAFRVEAFRAIIFQKAFRAIIFERCSDPLFFRVSVQSIDVQSQHSE